MGENYTLAYLGFNPDAPTGSSLVQTPYTNLAFLDPVKNNFSLSNIKAGDNIPFYLKANSYIDNKDELSLSNIFNSDFMRTLNYGTSALSSLAGIYLGFKQLGLARQQVGLAREQWETTKQELERIKRVRKKLTESYFS